jgi:hypothetical protein
MISMLTRSKRKFRMCIGSMHRWLRPTFLGVSKTIKKISVNAERGGSCSTGLKEDEKRSGDQDIDGCWKGKSSRKNKLYEQTGYQSMIDMKTIARLTLTSCLNLGNVWRCSLKAKRDRESWVLTDRHNEKRHRTWTRSSLKIMITWIFVVSGRREAGLTRTGN